jgi:hypothetical protein
VRRVQMFYFYFFWGGYKQANGQTSECSCIIVIIRLISDTFVRTEVQQKPRKRIENKLQLLVTDLLRYANRVEFGYNDIGLCDTSSITLHIVWYELIPQKAHLSLPFLVRHT